MNEYFVLAFIVMHILVVAAGYLSLVMLDRRIRQYRERHPAE